MRQPLSLRTALPAALPRVTREPLTLVGPAEIADFAADTCTLSVVIPCLNEAQNIEECVTRAWAALRSNGIDGEVIVADNGSDDGSAELAEAAGARVVHELERGYGSAYMAGLAAARGTYVLMADADLTYDFAEAPRFLAARDAVAAPLRRQPAPVGLPEAALPHQRRRRALRDASAAS